MTINKNINFSNLTVSKVFHNKSKQYKLLNSLSENVWNSYTKKMLSNKINIKYDSGNDVYIVSPLKENEMSNKKSLLQDQEEDQNMDSEIINILNGIDSDDEEEISDEVDEPIEDEILPVAPPTKSPIVSEPQIVDDTSINLSQFEELLKKVLSDTVASMPSGESNFDVPENEIPNNGEFQHENILDSEFESNLSNLDYIDQKIASGSYMGTIDPSYNQKERTLSDEINSVDNDINGATVNDVIGDDEDDFSHDSEVEELNDEDDYSQIDTNPENKGFIGNQAGIQEYNDYMTEDDFEVGGISDIEEQEPITANGTANINGQPVQIILTGVMITPTEISYISESAKKVGLKLKAVKGVKKIVHFFVEGNNKTYIIKYEDIPSWKTKTPFSIKENKFQTLDEAFERINSVKKNQIKEAKNFKKFMNKDIENRSITNIKESNILKEFEGKISKDYIAGWNIKSVGFINLKTGLNEVFSNITEHSKENNTLVLTKDGQYYLLKGNLKERSEVGTTRQLIDMENKKDFGIGKVVGVYENSAKGLGQIMYKVKRTSIPLLAWK